MHCRPSAAIWAGAPPRRRCFSPPEAEPLRWSRERTSPPGRPPRALSILACWSRLPTRPARMSWPRACRDARSCRSTPSWPEPRDEREPRAWAILAPAFEDSAVRSRVCRPLQRRRSVNRGSVSHQGRSRPGSTDSAARASRTAST